MRLSATSAKIDRVPWPRGMRDVAVVKRVTAAALFDVEPREPDGDLGKRLDLRRAPPQAG